MQGHELKAIRKSMDLRQVALANALGLTPQFIGMMERGEKPIEPRTALSVLYLLDHPEARPDVEIEDMRSYNIADMIDIFTDRPGLVDGRTWGRWRFSADSLSLDLDSQEVVMEHDGDGNPVMGRVEKYYVLLYEMTSAGAVLDWIGQIANKGWGAVTLGHFVEAVDEFFDIQTTFVHGAGFGSEADVQRYLRERVEMAKQRLAEQS